jgi:tetratricopeptide (TPR) repeat protein
MTSKTYLELKTKAEERFKAMMFDEARALYEKAFEAKDCDEMVLTSNISACYFESGDYSIGLCL